MPSERDADTPASGTSSVVVLGGSAHPALAVEVARELGRPLGRCAIEKFPDGEIHVQVDVVAVEGRDVFVVQPTSNVVSEHLLELLLVSDAARRAGAASVSAVVPYFGYARQDRRKQPGEALGARVVAELLGTAQLERIVSVDLHSDVVEASLDVDVEHLSAVPLLADALAKQAGPRAVLVAPDLGAVRLARKYAARLNLPVATVHKVRASGTDVSVERIAGDVRGLQPILVDDMISTGATIVAAARALRDAGSSSELIVAATHPVLAPGALDRLREVGVGRLFVADTIATTPTEANESAASIVSLVSVASLLAACIRRLAMQLRRIPPG